MQAEPKKRGRKSAADRVAEGFSVAVEALTQTEAQKPAEAPIPAFVDPSPEPAMPLADLIASKERADVPLVEVTHPEAEDGGFYQSKFSGIRLKKGPCRVMYSDGTTE